ncbi:hypothetical protein Tco_0050441, partial [Tanacetum coccineum]
AFTIRFIILPLRSHTHDLRRSSSVIISIFPDISRRARDAYHDLQDDDIMKNIFNSGRNKNKVGMRIPAWMITYEMKLMKHYKMYAEVFGLDVPLTQSQPTESTQGMHRTTSAPRSLIRSGYHQKDRKPSQNDKTEHGMEKTVQNQGQSPKKSKSKSIQKNQQSNRSRN